jgi:hypothetical protein
MRSLQRIPQSAGAALALGVAIAAVGPALAADPPALETRITSVALFKNGLGFVTRSAELPAGAGVVRIESLPAPAHGTFWVYSPDGGVTIRDLVASERDVVERIAAVSVPELIEANVGQTVELRMNEKDTFRAKIVSVPADRLTDASNASPSYLRYGGNAGVVEAASAVVVQTANGQAAVNKNAVLQVSSPGGVLKTTIERRKRGVTLRLRAGGKGRIAVAYLAKGITWAPSCAIDISDPKKARVTLKAEIIDEIEDLEDAQVSFVTGFPNLKFADVVDPMALRGDLAAFIQSLSNPALAARNDRSVVMQQAVLDNFAREEETAFPAYSTAPPEGQTREELFFYPQRGVTLARRERGYYPLFTAEVPYEHLYEWKIGDMLDEQEQYRAPQAGPPLSEDVWHGIRLTNSSTAPWTTAPAMTMQEGHVLGQDLIYYTSVGSKSTVRITKAVDVKAEQAEFEVKRERNAARFYNENYDLVDVSGKLKATSYKDKAITLTITKELSGEVVKSAPVAKVEQTAKGLRKVNPKSILTWELPVKAKGRIEIDYSYKVYVRAY